jgi:hypothetical protein
MAGAVHAVDWKRLNNGNLLAKQTYPSNATQKRCA